MATKGRSISYEPLQLVKNLFVQFCLEKTKFFTKNCPQIEFWLKITSADCVNSGDYWAGSMIRLENYLILFSRWVRLSQISHFYAQPS